MERSQWSRLRCAMRREHRENGGTARTLQGAWWTARRQWSRVATRTVEETETFGTMKGQLLDVADGLVFKRYTHVAIESTGVYCQVSYNILEGKGIDALLLNARDTKTVPGRKTDAKDAGQIRASVLSWALLGTGSCKAALSPINQDQTKGS